MSGLLDLVADTLLAFANTGAVLVVAVMFWRDRFVRPSLEFRLAVVATLLGSASVALKVWRVFA